MSDEYWGYSVCENSNDAVDPSIEDVVRVSLERADTPRENHHQFHIDELISDAVADFGRSKVEECIRLHIHDGLPQRTAGRTAFGSEHYVRGIDVGVAASLYLRELRRR